MDDTTRALHDRAELEEVMNRYAASIDLRDWARLGTVFADGEIEADFTSMGVKQVFRGPAERWVDAVRQTITGFDATPHFFANHSAEVDGDRAVDTRYMQARHQFGTEHCRRQAEGRVPRRIRFRNEEPGSSPENQESDRLSRRRAVSPRYLFAAIS